MKIDPIAATATTTGNGFWMKITQTKAIQNNVINED